MNIRFKLKGLEKKIFYGPFLEILEKHRKSVKKD